MTVQEVCSVLTTVAFVMGAASLIRAMEVRRQVDQYSLDRWQREEEEKREKGFE